MSRNDAATLITMPWLIEVGFRFSTSPTSLKLASANGKLFLTVWDRGDCLWWSVVNEFQATVSIPSPPRTRGSLRILCRFFGMKLQQKPPKPKATRKASG